MFLCYISQTIFAWRHFKGILHSGVLIFHWEETTLRGWKMCSGKCTQIIRISHWPHVPIFLFSLLSIYNILILTMAHTWLMKKWKRAFLVRICRFLEPVKRNNSFLLAFFFFYVLLLFNFFVRLDCRVAPKVPTDLNTAIRLYYIYIT